MIRLSARKNNFYPFQCHKFSLLSFIKRTCDEGNVPIPQTSFFMQLAARPVWSQGISPGPITFLENAEFLWTYYIFQI